VNEWTLYETPYQSIKKAEQVDEYTLVLTGEVWGLVTKASYEMTFYIPKTSSSSDQGLRETAQLAFNVDMKPVLGTFNRVFLNYWCNNDENFYGFGTQVGFEFLSILLHF
jgi:hypothetical protein